MSEKQIAFTDSVFSVDETFDDPRFMKIRVAAMHSGINRNKSRFSTECIKKAKDSFKNIPILADVQEYTDDNGNSYLDYSGHSMHIENDKFNDGEDRIIYDEKVVGIVPEKNNFELVHDDETGHDYSMVDALIFREYGNYVADILENRGGKTDVSAEIAVDDCSFSAKDKCLDVGKMQMCAITLLGEHVTPGMEKAHAEVFSLDNKSREEQLIQVMQELTKALNNYNQTKEGGTNVDAEIILEEVTEQEEVTTVVESTEEETVTAEETLSEETTEVTPEIVTEEAEEETVIEEALSEEVVEPTVTYSMSIGDTKKEFSVSLNDKIYALQQLVNDTYEEDGDWYSVEVFEDTKTVEMHGWVKSYRQSYKVKGDNYSLVGDRVELFVKYLTADEISKLENMKANYSSMEEKIASCEDKLSKYEEEPEKMKILESNDYSQISDSEEFVALKNQDKHFDMSIDEVRSAADQLLLSYAKTHTLEFRSIEPEATHEVSSKKLVSNPKKLGTYGRLHRK